MDIPENISEYLQNLIKYSERRTKNHIHLVKQFGDLLGYDFSNHDHSKFSEELKIPYIMIDNSYRKDIDPTVEYTEELALASFRHIKMEPHHPEYWDSLVTMNFQVGRDEPDVVSTVNAYKMPVKALAEMCCDWCAMSYELDSDPKDWAKKNIGYRWSFSGRQESFIYAYLNYLWDQKDAIQPWIDVKEEVLDPIVHIEPLQIYEQFDHVLKESVNHGQISANDYRKIKYKDIKRIL